jgi:hypothetical protein
MFSAAANTLPPPVHTPAARHADIRRPPKTVSDLRRLQRPRVGVGWLVQLSARYSISLYRRLCPSNIANEAQDA